MLRGLVYLRMDDKSLQFYIIFLLSGVFQLFMWTSNYQTVRKGTAILASVNNERIILAMDSRSLEINTKLNSTTINDTINKIHKLGVFFYGIAGASRFRDIDLHGVIESIYNNKIPLKDNALVIDARLFELYKSYYNSLTIDEINIHSSLIPVQVNSVLIAGYENDKPVVAQIGIGIQQLSDSSFHVTRSAVQFHDRINSPSLFYAGHATNTLRLINNGYDISNLNADNLINFIKEESKLSDMVGNEVNFVVIKREGNEHHRTY